MCIATYKVRYADLPTAELQAKEQTKARNDDPFRFVTAAAMDRKDHAFLAPAADRVGALFLWSVASAVKTEDGGLKASPRSVQKRLWH